MQKVYSLRIELTILPLRPRHRALAQEAIDLSSHSGGVQQLAMILNIIEDQGVEMRTLLLGASMALV